MRTSALTALTASCLLLVHLLGATSAHAAQFLIRAGDDWSTLKSKLKPGDEVILMPGQHRGARFEDLAGTEEQPIVIRSADPSRLSTIAAGDVGLHLVRCKFIRVEKVIVSGGKRACVIIAGDGDARAERIALIDVYVAKSGDEGEQCGVRVERADHVMLKNCRIEAWHRAGVHVHASSDVALDGAQFVGTPTTVDQFGVVVDGGSSSVIVERCRFGPGIGTSVAVGPHGVGSLPSLPTATPTADPEAERGTKNAKPTERPVLAEGVTVERCLAKRNGTFVAFGSCASVLVRANTIVDPTSGYTVSEPPKDFAGVRNSTFLANLLVWTPGTMKSFCDIKPGADPAGLVLEANLWHSPELPMAQPTLGEFRGVLKGKQVTDLDPKLDGYDRPQAEGAQIFGWSSA